MYKLISSLPLALLIGCTTLTTPTNAALQANAPLSQRDLQNPAIAQPGGGFVATEAKQLLEFCIELNNQDDRNNPQKKSDPQYQAKPSGWKIVYDSRHPGNMEWNKNWPSTASDPEPNNPEKNGFGPFNNAWLLVQSEAEPKNYAIAIRGTVGEINSILADAFVTSTPAYAGIEYPKNKVLPIVFAATPKSEVHLGFAYAAFSLLFEREKGILAQLRKLNLPQDAKLFITGHSQGAAIATLVHSFLYYALSGGSEYHYQLNLTLAGINNSGNKRNAIQLKSYVFAQPKPGNQQYAQDFARITKDVSYVINNDRDPVQQVPLTLQKIGDVAEGVEEDIAGTGNFLQKIGVHIAGDITRLKTKLRGAIAKKVADRVADIYASKDQKDKNFSINEEYFKSDTNITKTVAKSLNYTLAGQLIPVFGAQKGGKGYPIGDSQDFLLQHHATSYRKLVECQIEPKEAPNCN